ncbi:MAG: hypothetical protein R3B67_01700 [Phycisphaerales bacterium]
MKMPIARHGGGPRTPAFAAVGVVPGLIEKQRDGLVPNAGLRRGGHGPVGVVARVVDQDAHGLMGGERLPVAISVVEIIT